MSTSRYYAPTTFIADGLAEIKELLCSNASTSAKHISIEWTPSTSGPSQERMLVLDLLKASPRAQFIEYIISPIFSGLGSEISVADHEKPRSDAMRTLEINWAHDLTIIETLSCTPELEILSMYYVQLTELAIESPPSPALPRLRRLSVLGSPYFGSLGAIVSSACGTLRSIKVDVSYENMVSLFRYHMAANHIVHLEVYGCRDQTMDASAVAVRACPHIRHLGLYSRAGMVYLDALMHRTLGILQLPLLSLAVSSRGLNGQILADLLSQPHPALVQLRVLAVKDTTHAALRRACENRRILLRRLNGLAHLTKGPSRFDALFGRGKRWD